jgi:hypothetical protein
VFRAAGEIETTEESIQDWLQLNEGPWISAFDKGRYCCSEIIFIVYQQCL